MRKLVFVSSLLLISVTTHAGERVRCQHEVERQERSLSRESRANPEDKVRLIKQIDGDEFTVSREVGENIRALLLREDTLAFSFGNDSGTWLSIANENNCKVLLTTEVSEN